MVDRTITMGDLIGQYLGEPGRGLTFFVDTVNGADANDGREPDDALATITAALAKCVADRGDVIFVMQFGVDQGETWPLALDTNGVRLIAARSGSFMPAVRVNLTAGSAGAAIDIAAHDVSVQGFMLRPSGANPAITFSGAKGSLSILDCLFDRGSYGIYSEWGGVGWGLDISRNWFGGALSAGGIYINDDPGTVRIRDNYFGLGADGGQIAIQIYHGANGEIINNRFGVYKTDVVGYAIYMEALTHRWLITGNHAGTASGNMAVNPYRDLANGVQALNNWGINYAGIVPIYPATA